MKTVVKDIFSVKSSPYFSLWLNLLFLVLVFRKSKWSLWTEGSSWWTKSWAASGSWSFMLGRKLSCSVWASSERTSLQPWGNLRSCTAPLWLHLAPPPSWLDTETLKWFYIDNKVLYWDITHFRHISYTWTYNLKNKINIQIVNS